MPPFSPPPSFLHRCPGCCGDEYRHSQHRHGLRSQHGRWIFIIITARFMLPNVPGTAAISSEVSYTYHGGSIRDGARSLITFRGGGDIKKKMWRLPSPLLLPQTHHRHPLLSLRICSSGVLLHLNSKHTLTGALGRTAPAARTERAASVCVFVCVSLLHVVKPRCCNFVASLSHTRTKHAKKKET